MIQTAPVRHANPAGATPPVSGAYKVDVARGERIGRVSSEWFSRPGDERYLSLSALHEAVRARAERATARTVKARALRVEASRDDAERLALVVLGREEPIAPTHWSFGRICSLVGAPASYLRQLPAPLAGINLQHGLLSHRAELVKTLEADDGRVELRAFTGSDYGRIWDHELVEAVMRIAENGTCDTRWKVPGLLDWSTMTHNPFVEVTQDTTTLYASDRDVFLFLVDDAHPAGTDKVCHFVKRRPGRVLIAADRLLRAIAAISGQRDTAISTEPTNAGLSTTWAVSGLDAGHSIVGSVGTKEVERSWRAPRP